MPQVELNYVAIIVAALIPMVIGALWYGPLFAKPWMAAMNLTSEDLELLKTQASRGYILTAIASLIMAFVLAHWVDYMQATTIGEGAQTGFWAWAGFVVTTSVGPTVFEGRSGVTYWLNNGYHLVSLAIMGALLAAWQ